MSLPSAYDPKLWLALLAEIDRFGGKARPSDIYPRMQQHFPEITDADLILRRRRGENVWTNTIQWARMHLVNRGCIDNSSRGVWAITPLGKKWLQQEWRGPNADYSSVTKPPATSAVRSPSQPVASPTSIPTVESRNEASASETASVGPATVAPLLDPIDLLCKRLRASQRQSLSPKVFEQDLTDAFSLLGFESVHIGGAGDADIVITAAMGPSSYSVIIDAKSTQSGKVSDAQISWPVIDSHRRTRGATFAAVIGEDFSGGQLRTFANQYNVTLITTEMICDLLKLHAEAPFNLQDLRLLFDQPGRADTGLQALRELSSRTLRHWRLISEIVDTIGKFQRATPAGSAPKVENLHFHLMLKNDQSPAAAPTLEEVDAAVAFLASRAVHVLVEVPGSNGAYQLGMTSTTARRRLLALARFFDSQNLIGSATLSHGQPTVSTG